MSSINNRFGELLTEGISSVARRQNRRLDTVERDIAEQVEYSQATIQKWRRGKHLTRISDHVEQLVRYCVLYGRVDRRWADSLLYQGRYYKDREALLNELFPNSSQPQAKPNLPEPKPVVTEISTSGGGTQPVSVASGFYIERSSDKEALGAITQKGGATITIRGPRRMGKTSLLHRMCDTAKRDGKQVALLDFQRGFDQADLADGTTFFRQFCNVLTHTLGLENKVEYYWNIPLSNSMRCTEYMTRHILPTLNKPLVLAMDEVDRIFGSTFQDDFFGMVRSWHNDRSVQSLGPEYSQESIFRQLDLILVTSTDPHNFIKRPDKSPFNVGNVIVLENFTPAQMTELNQKYEKPLTAEQLDQLFALLGGHPYLLHVALYRVARQHLSATDLFNKATDENGPFGLHLRRHVLRLRSQPELADSMRQVIINNSCPSEHFFRLYDIGLVQKKGDAVLPRCQLYVEYFRRHLVND